MLSAEQARERAGDNCKWSLLQRHGAGGCSGTEQEAAAARSRRLQCHGAVGWRPRCSRFTFCNGVDTSSLHAFGKDAFGGSSRTYVDARWHFEVGPVIPSART